MLQPNLLIALQLSVKLNYLACAQLETAWELGLHQRDFFIIIVIIGLIMKAFLSLL